MYMFNILHPGKFYCSSHGETLLRVLGEMLEHDDLEVQDLFTSAFLSVVVNI